MRPHVVVNVAMSADGKLSTRERRQVKISGPLDFARTDRLKAESDAVMVGIGTVLADDPSLTVKSEENRRLRTMSGKPEHPVRIVVDSRGRTPTTAAILHKGSGQRIVAVSGRADQGKVTALERFATVLVAGKETVDLAALLEQLYSLGIRQLMVEGGGSLIAGMFCAGLVDELYTFVGNIIIGGSESPTPADGSGWIREPDFQKLSLVDATRMEEGILLHWNVLKKS